MTRFLLSLCLVAMAALFAAADDKPKRLLLVTHSGGFMHNSVGTAEDVLKAVGPKHGYEVTCWRLTNPTDPALVGRYKLKKDAPDLAKAVLEKYTAEYKKGTEDRKKGTEGKTVAAENMGHINKDTLKNFDAVLFFTTGNPVTAEELTDLIEWTKAGGAFAGSHCGADTLYNTAYGDFIGAYFKTHPAPTTVKLKVEDPKHPAAAGLSDGQPLMDEIYIFRDQPYTRDKLHIILSCQPGSFNPTGKDQARSDKDYALSWCKAEGKGKVFYTAFGHHREMWENPAFQGHLFGGLDWATGKKPGDATPSATTK